LAERSHGGALSGAHVPWATSLPLPATV
jgi:hypothetical protein